MLTIKKNDQTIAYFDNVFFAESDEGDGFFNSLSFTYDSDLSEFVITLLNDNTENTETLTFTDLLLDDTNVSGLSYQNDDSSEIPLRSTVIYDYLDFDFVADEDLTLYIIETTPVVEDDIDVSISDVNGTSLWTDQVTGSTLTRINVMVDTMYDVYRFTFSYLHNGIEYQITHNVSADGSDVPYAEDFAGFELNNSGEIDLTTSYIFTETALIAGLEFKANQPTPPNPTFDMDVSIDTVDGTVDNSVTVQVYEFVKFEMTYNSSYNYYDLKYVYLDKNNYTITGHLYSVADGVDIPFKEDMKTYRVNGSGEYYLGTEYINSALKELTIAFNLKYDKGTPKDLFKKCCDLKLKDLTIDNVLYESAVNDFFKLLYSIFVTPPAWIRNYINISDEYFMNHSGRKYVSPMMKRLLKDVQFKSDYTQKMNRLVQSFWIKYGQDIENYYDNYKTKFMIDHEEGFERTRTPNLTENFDWSENKVFSDTQSGNPSESYYGFNSANATPVSKSSLDSKVEHSALEKDNFEKHEKRNTGTETTVENQKHYHGDLFENGLNALQFFKLYNFYDYLFERIDKVLTIDLY